MLKLVEFNTDCARNHLYNKEQITQILSYQPDIICLSETPCDNLPCPFEQYIEIASTPSHCGMSFAISMYHLTQ